MDIAILGNVIVRNITPQEFESYVDYWHSKELFRLEKDGLRDSNLIPREHMLSSLRIVYQRDGVVNSVKVIEYGGEIIGSFSATDICDERLVLHCSIWDQDFQGKGIGTIAYWKAIVSYFDSYDVDFIDFYTPKNNIAAVSVKRKLGIPAMGETEFTVYLSDEPIPVYHYRVSRGYQSQFLNDF